MRAHLAAAPTWVHALISGLLFGAGITVWSSLREDGGSLTARLVLGVLAGALFAAVMGVFLRREYGAARDEMAALPIEQRRAVLRAAGRGPAPADAAVRAAALRPALRSRDMMRRRSRFNLTVFTGALIGYALLALTQSPWWWWLSFAMFAGFLAAQLVLPHRIERRISVLSAPPGAATPKAFPE